MPGSRQPNVVVVLLYGVVIPGRSNKATDSQGRIRQDVAARRFALFPWQRVRSSPVSGSDKVKVTKCCPQLSGFVEARGAIVAGRRVACPPKKASACVGRKASFNPPRSFRVPNGILLTPLCEDFPRHLRLSKAAFKDVCDVVTRTLSGKIVSLL